MALINLTDREEDGEVDQSIQTYLSDLKPNKHNGFHHTFSYISRTCKCPQNGGKRDCRLVKHDNTHINIHQITELSSHLDSKAAIL